MRIFLLVLFGFVLGCGDDKPNAPRSPADARAELDRRGIAYTEKVFFAAAVSGDWEVVRLFVQAGMSVDTRLYGWGWDGWTVLHFAAVDGNLAVVKFLVEQGANIRLLTDGRVGFTPLALAARAGHFEIVKYLESRDG